MRRNLTFYMTAVLFYKYSANTTMNELDLKLDLLTYLNWDFDPFIQVPLIFICLPLKYLFLYGSLHHRK